MSIYAQLSQLNNQFIIKQSKIGFIAAQKQLLVSDSTNRIYIAFSFMSAGLTMQVSPIDNFTLSDGFPLVTGVPLEFWSEKHKSLPSQKWFGFDSTASAITVTILEISYAVVENYERAQILRPETSTGEVDAS